MFNTSYVTCAWQGRKSGIKSLMDEVALQKHMRWFPLKRIMKYDTFIIPSLSAEGSAHKLQDAIPGDS